MSPAPVKIVMKKMKTPCCSRNWRNVSAVGASIDACGKFAATYICTARTMKGSQAMSSSPRNLRLPSMFLMPAAAMTVQARPSGARSPRYRR